MKINEQETRLQRLQRGQALVEYWPTIPAAIAIMVMASLLASGINNSFRQTLNGLQRFCTSSEMTPSTAEIFQHSIRSSASVYDPDTNRTTIAYTVTSGTQPSISHWILGVPREVANRVIQTSEAWSWTDNDPTTGAVGMKFDIGYEPSGGSSGDNSGGGGNGGGNGNGNNRMRQFNRTNTLLLPVHQTEEATETRYISITLEGTYQFGTLSVTIKAGTTQVGSGTVSGPIAVDNDSNDQNSDSGSGNSANGCA